MHFDTNAENIENIQYLKSKISDKYLAYITDVYCVNPTS